MEQVSGRAGRKGEKGKVIIQTYQPTHPVILNVVSHDYVRFFEEQMPIRRQFCYPPYYRLIMIKLRITSIFCLLTKLVKTMAIIILVHVVYLRNYMAIRTTLFLVNTMMI